MTNKKLNEFYTIADKDILDLMINHSNNSKKNEILDDEEYNLIKYSDAEYVSSVLDIVLSDMTPPPKEVLVEYIKLLESRNDADCEEIKYIISLCKEYSEI